MQHSIDYIRYLEAKRSVDDRALNKEVLNDFKRLLRNVANEYTVRILEIGAGTGAMLRRFLATEFFQHQRRVEYTMVDHKADVLIYARHMLTGEKLSESMQKSTGDTTDLHLASTDDMQIPSVAVQDMDVHFRTDDALAYLRGNEKKFDAVVAAAFLDHVGLDETIPLIRNSLLPESPIRAFYFPINFSGVTRFKPDVNQAIIDAFHSSMGRMNAGGIVIQNADTGLHIERTVKYHEALDVTFGSSNWFVDCNANAEGGGGDEAYFVRGIIAFISGTRKEHIVQSGVKVDCFNAEVDKLFRILERKHLKYLAGNIDVCGRFPVAKS